jgi:hypothetical protein
VSVLLLALDLSAGGDVGDPPSAEVSYNNIWRREVGDTSAGIRVAVVTPSGSFEDYAVRSGVSYEYRAQAVGVNGTSTYSDWV